MFAEGGALDSVWLLERRGGDLDRKGMGGVWGPTALFVNLRTRRSAAAAAGPGAVRVRGGLRRAPGAADGSPAAHSSVFFSTHCFSIYVFFEQV